MTSMINGKSIAAATAVFIVVLTAAVVIAVSYPRDYDEEYDLTVYRVEGGWGYDIGFNGSTIIHQPFIPALPGNSAFPDRASALAVGRLVIDRLSAGDSPSLDRDEVISLIKE